LITSADQGQRRLKLCDFGRSAKPGERLFPASFGFTAPEVGPDVTDLDPFLADVYSVGVILRCMALRSERGADLEKPVSTSCTALRIANEMTADDVQSRKPLKEYHVPSLSLGDWPQM
jgi:serine/threonine protein kinase